MTVARGTYRIKPPLIRPSKLTRPEAGGVGKDLSDGYCLNFAVGCEHACPFCYAALYPVRQRARYGELVDRKWGDYLLVPENLGDAIDATPWPKWRGKEVMMSSTHDPYLPQLAAWARVLLRELLHSGIRVCLQTRSYLVLKDLELLAEFPDLVRLQVSIATMDRGLARVIEPRVPPPERRLEVLRKAKDAGLRVGVIVAPVFPRMRARPQPTADVRSIVERLAEIGPDHVYGESLHVRGANLALIESALGERPYLQDDAATFDYEMGVFFRDVVEFYGLTGTWWPEHRAEQASLHNDPAGTPPGPFSQGGV